MRAFAVGIVALLGGLQSLSAQTVAHADLSRVDMVPYVSPATVEARMEAIENEIALHYHPRVQGFIDYFTIRNREYTARVIAKAQLYFPLFEKKLAEYGLPDELKYLAIVESGLRPAATSRAGAGGLWQFMPYTGRSFGLYQTWYKDDRFDPEEATEAACKYLKQLYAVTGDWELALAAYNAGPGNVRKAKRRSGKTYFWDIYPYLPRETRSYVPQFVAITYLFNHLEDYNFHQVPSYYQPEVDTLQVQRFVHLETLAKSVGVCMEDLQALNPALKSPYVPDDAKGYPLYLPAEAKLRLNADRPAILALANSTGRQEMEWQLRNEVGSTYGRTKLTHRVRSGDVLGAIAEHYHVRVADLRAWNNIRGNLIRVNQQLNVWVKTEQLAAITSRSYSQPAPQARSVAQPKPIPEGSPSHVVKPGESLWSISRMYQGLSIERLKELNGLENNKLMPGQRLRIG